MEFHCLLHLPIAFISSPAVSAADESIDLKICYSVGMRLESR